MVGPKHHTSRIVHNTENLLAKPVTTRRHHNKTFATHFNSRSRCHHHPQVYMTTKKVWDCWKILVTTYPTCIEANYGKAESRMNGRSVSTSSRRPPDHKEGEPVVGSAALPRVPDRALIAYTLDVPNPQALGIWKFLYATCPDCAHNATSHAGADRSRSFRNIVWFLVLTACTPHPTGW